MSREREYKADKYETAVRIVERLQRKDFQAYFVGGAVRDILLGRNTKDIDVVTSALPEQISSIFSRTYGIGASFGIINVVEDGINFDVATFRTETGYQDGRHPCSIIYTDNPQDDSRRRDFTINALYLDPVKNEFLDFHDGRGDLKRGVLRTIGSPEKRFSEDCLRMLRAIRIGVELGFTIDADIISTIKSFADRAVYLSSERIRDELTKMFISPAPDVALQLLYDTGLLGVILPEVARMKGVTQPEKFHPEGDVFEHTKIMLKNMSMPSSELAWAVLLHDVGKPPTFKVGEDGVEHFYLHADCGYHMAFEILQRLKFPAIFVKNVSYAVKNHMRFAEVQRMRVSKYKNIIAADTFPLELELHRLDCVSSNEIMGNFIFLLDKIHEQSGERELPPPLITGECLLKLGYPQGPEIGRILREVRDKQIEGVFKTKLEAVRFVTKNYPQKN